MILEVCVGLRVVEVSRMLIEYCSMQWMLAVGLDGFGCLSRFLGGVWLG